MQVVEDGPAARAGLRAGDLIVAVNGNPVATMSDLQRLLVSELVGSAATLTVARDERVLDVSVVPDELVT